MNKKVFSQLDSRWSDKPYPTSRSTFGGNGCGACAVTHIAIEQESKENWTPEVMRKWMINHGYVVSGKGTLWSGIEAALKYIGHKTVVWIGQDDPMSAAWKELNKGNRIGVLLVDNGKTPNGTVWTSSGHYVAFTKYRIKNGLHQFYIKDSGGRQHTGWYTYEKSLKGALPQLWIVKRIKEYTIQDKMAAFAKLIANDKHFHYEFYKDSTTCPICTKRIILKKKWDADKGKYVITEETVKGKRIGGNCIWFAFACWHHVGIKCKCKCDAMTDQLWEKIRVKSSKNGTKIVQDRLGIDDVKVIRKKGGKTIPLDKLKKGDIIAYFVGNDYKHTALYLGDGKIADCTSTRNDNIKYGVKSYEKMSIKVALRYIGK